MARARTVPRHTAGPAKSGQQSPDVAAEQREQTDERNGSAGATTGRHGRRAANHEHHSMFEERSVLDALWSAVVAAPTSVMPPPAPEPAAAEDDTPPAPEALAAPPAAATPVPVASAAPEPFVPVLGRPVMPGPVAMPTTMPTPPKPAPTPDPADTALAAGMPGMAPPTMPPPATRAQPAPPTHAAPHGAAPHTAAPHTAAPHTAPGPAAPGPAASDSAATAHGPHPEHAAPPRATGPFDLSYAAQPSTNRTIWAGPRHAAPPDWTSTSALLTIETPAAVADAGLLVLRLVVGLTMAAHGAQKAFGLFGGDGLGPTADGFSALGYQPGALFALAAIVGELFGGLFLAIGLLTPLAAGGIIGVTVNAMVAVNLGNGFFASHDGIELPLILSGGALALLLTGPGRYAADARIPFFNGAAVQCAAAGIALLAMLTSLGAHLL
ncbi:DoxX family protein [Cryptosporangium aurantiacum]|uniref:Uncharacterized membrane protein YphA, DoxX/SURF4 family n=1 Tax=Cryptosporangium aurantiacum TaxID=134849 RepID=A0A1M7NB67_9ACTN|nr:DoxX family protein [Cryptosporangium aurantiacum]SHN00878.1 Uncharacterized membrane protein YphA, DoxX/SURF4 family [Cryptosporangium aurantiacum]